jgi:hypothetical protein
MIRMIKSRRIRWARNVARMEEKRNAYRVLVESQKERHRWEELVVVGWIILKLILAR